MARRRFVGAAPLVPTRPLVWPFEAAAWRTFFLDLVLALRLTFLPLGVARSAAAGRFFFFFFIFAVGKPLLPVSVPEC